MSSPPPTKVFLEGRYKKLTRDLPQTIFWCPECKGHPRRRRKCSYCEGFGKLTRDSVQELLGWVLGKSFGTRKHKFHGAGREDMDVRMLGDGRPFVIELIGPRTHDVDLAELEALVNERNEGRLEILGLHWTEKSRVRVLKEDKHAKRYQALVEIDGELDLQEFEARKGERVTIAQRTPSRVAHRRADKVRERWIELDAVEAAPEGRWSITLTTEHGTYVKEAISGEDQKTTPSLGDLLGGIQCRCIELDVLAILNEDGGSVEPLQRAPQGLGFGAGVES